MASTQNSCGQTSQKVTGSEEADGFGRPEKTKLFEGAGTMETKAVYDGAGRVKQRYLPYRAPAADKTEASYDWLGRVTAVISPGVPIGGTRSYGYRVNQTWMRDEAGKWTRSLVDGLGRLKEVEADPAVASGIVTGFSNPSGLAYLTQYTYDVLDNLTVVTQGTLGARTFTYNSLGWLLTATNPESGTVTYDYDSNGNPASRSDGRGAVTTSSYDNWRRIEGKTYPAGRPMFTIAGLWHRITLGTETVSPHIR